MPEYTHCPGECGSRVKIWGGKGINYCCHPCWKTYWSQISGDLPPDAPHSVQCDTRQTTRLDKPIVTDREFYVMGPSDHRRVRNVG